MSTAGKKDEFKAHRKHVQTNKFTAITQRNYQYTNKNILTNHSNGTQLHSTQPNPIQLIATQHNITQPNLLSVHLSGRISTRIEINTS